MAVIPLSNEGPWDTLNKMANQYKNDASNIESAKRSLQKGDLEGDYDEDDPGGDAYKKTAGVLKAQKESGMYTDASAGGDSTTSAGQNKVANEFAQGLREGGIDNPNAIAGIVGRAQMESGFNPTQSHDGGSGFGLMGFRDPTPGNGRWTALKKFAAANGASPASPRIQGMFAAGELTGATRQYGSDESAYGPAVLGAKSPDAAYTAYTNHVVRPADPNASAAGGLFATRKWFSKLTGATSKDMASSGGNIAIDPLGNTPDENGYFTDNSDGPNKGRKYQYHEASVTDLQKLKSPAAQISTGINPDDVQPEPLLKSKNGKMGVRIYQSGPVTAAPPSTPTVVASAAPSAPVTGGTVKAAPKDDSFGTVKQAEEEEEE